MKKKNNTGLLKPNTVYSISINPKYINIDGKKYDFELDYVAMGLDVDGDCIKTLVNISPRAYVYKYGVSDINVHRPIKVLNQIFDNYNHLLKDGGVYEISLYPECYITINNKKYEYKLNTYNLHLDLNGDTIKIEIGEDGIYYAVVDSEITNLNGLTLGDTEKFPFPREAITIVKPCKKEISNLDQARLGTANGKNISTKVLYLLHKKMEPIISKLVNSESYKNGENSINFIALNGEMLDMKYIDKMLSEITFKNMKDYINIIPIGLLETCFTAFTVEMLTTIHAFNVKYYIISFFNIESVIPSDTKYLRYEPDIKNILKLYENYYKVLKTLLKLKKILESIRKEQK